MTARSTPQRIAALRRFNRFYTRQIGALRRTYLDSGYALGELRVLYEIAHGDAPTATDIARALDFDPGYLSRMLRNFEKRRLIRRETSPTDARQSHLALTGRGRRGLCAARTAHTAPSRRDAGQAVRRRANPSRRRNGDDRELDRAKPQPPRPR